MDSGLCVPRDLAEHQDSRWMAVVLLYQHHLRRVKSDWDVLFLLPASPPSTRLREVSLATIQGPRLPRPHSLLGRPDNHVDWPQLGWIGSAPLEVCVDIGAFDIGVLPPVRLFYIRLSLGQGSTVSSSASQ